MSRKLKIDISDLAFAFGDCPLEASYYLHLETGELVYVSDETRRELERLQEGLPDDEGEEVESFSEALQQRNLPEWMDEELLHAYDVACGYGTRYVAMPRDETSDAYQDMEDFIDTVKSSRVQEEFWDAIRGRGAFRRFRETLAGYPKERERWFKFRDEQVRQRVLEWLESKDIEPAD